MSTLQVATIKSNSSAAPVIQNTSGTEKGQFAKAWVNFDGENTVSIRDSFNVSSITDEGTGDYIINWSATLANSNYSVVVGHSLFPHNGSTHGILYIDSISTTGVDISNRADDNGSNMVDKSIVTAAVFGDV